MPPFVVIVYVGTLAAVLLYAGSIWMRRRRLDHQVDETQRRS
ncbi:MAG: hypothetical protein U0822_01095 [Anaerolineae bacterium]